MNTATDKNKTHSKGKKLKALLLGVVLSLVLLEVGLRLVGTILLSSQTGANQEGLDFDNPKQYRILCLGESTTAEWFSEGRAGAWPHQLEVILNKNQKERSYKVINEGLSGTMTPFIVSKLPENLEKYRPHLVITMMGINDKDSSIIYGEKGDDVKMTLVDLRVVKFFRILGTAMLERAGVMRTSSNLNNIKKDFIRDKKPFELIEKHLVAKEYDKVDNVLESLYAKYPKRKQVVDAEYARVMLGVLQNVSNIEPAFLDMAEDCFQELVDRGDPDFYQLSFAYNGLSFIYRYRKDDVAYVDTIRNGLRYFEYEGSRHIALMQLADIQRKNDQPDPIIDQILKENNISLENREKRYANTKIHYQMLFNQLKKANIPYVAMQYPTKSVRLLKYFLSNESDPTVEASNRANFAAVPDPKFDAVLKNDPDILFVSNEENFKKALEEKPFEAIFSDHFGGTFGHTTNEGHRLIATHLYDSLRRSGILKNTP